jgi:hypothetical protein
MFGRWFSKGISGVTEVEVMEGVEGELLAPRLAASNIVDQPPEGQEGGTTSATLGSQQHRWPHAWSRAQRSIGNIAASVSTVSCARRCSPLVFLQLMSCVQAVICAANH